MCRNTEGGYECSCANGYIVRPENRSECVAESGKSECMRERQRGREGEERERKREREEGRERREREREREMSILSPCRLPASQSPFCEQSGHQGCRDERAKPRDPGEASP